MHSRLRPLVLGLFLASLSLTGPSWATSTAPERPSPPPDVIDCALDGNKKTCVECRSGGILACCYDDHCDVKNPPPKLSVPPRSPWSPWSPSPWVSWEIL